ncbi:Uncharacterised protein [Mycobacterium tuberculosis]|uniref:Uncharacterized protein n=1 Tax=Mycobacterium tuberculosis TaxID=1773 RepID=A0A655EYN7_MYCTX|nr:Uncharacterised protein [Mycobacterium tuberculosis]CKS96023.1 Uncharacterised protein [Mycobacterium tuberculosis]CKW13646.1 Uncharacterised protein [Mycobacterium tuberculosis]CNV40706.1 Uncharacterised protein [Mycobacterium tuberculosis]
MLGAAQERLLRRVVVHGAGDVVVDATGLFERVGLGADDVLGQRTGALIDIDMCFGDQGAAEQLRRGQRAGPCRIRSMPDRPAFHNIADRPTRRRRQAQPAVQHQVPELRLTREVIGILAGHLDVQNALKRAVTDDRAPHLDGVGTLGGIDRDVIGDFEQPDRRIRVCGYRGVGDRHRLAPSAETGLCSNNRQIGCQPFGEPAVESAGRKSVGAQQF